MIGRFLIISTLSVVVSSCASAGVSWNKTASDYYQADNRVNSLIEARKFDEARSFAHETGDFCDGNNVHLNFCDGQPHTGDVEFAGRIDHLQKCDELIQAANRENPFPREEAIAFSKRLDAACNSDWEHGQTFPWPLSWSSGLSLARQKLKDSELHGALSERMASGEQNPVAVAENKCLSGMRWGYMTQKRHAPPTIMEANDGKTKSERSAIIDLPGAVDPATLKGEYETSDKCEEASLTDRESVSHCRERYVGAPVMVSLAKIDVMQGGHRLYGSKLSVYFSSMQRCEVARTAGFDHQSDESLKPEFRKIAPYGSSYHPRFIGSCEAVTEIICEQGSAKPTAFHVLE